MPPWPFSSSPSTSPSSGNVPDPLGSRHGYKDPSRGSDDRTALTRRSPQMLSRPDSPHSRKLSNTVFSVPKRKPIPTQEAVSKPIPPVVEWALHVDAHGHGGDFEVGKCATCDTKVKWSKGGAEFKCSVCQMVNNPRTVKVPQPTEQPNERDVIPIDIARTKATLYQCIEMHLTSRLSGAQNRNSQDAIDVKFSQVEAHERRGIQTRAVEQVEHGLKQDIPSPTSKSPSVKPSRRPIEVDDRVDNRLAKSVPKQSLPAAETPSASKGTATTGARAITHQSQLEAEKYDLARSIFKPLEEHILETFGSYKCLNCSFLTIRPPARPAFHSEDDIRPRASLKQTRRPLTPEATYPELDAKTIRLGDFAENGSWWAGSSERSKSTGKQRQRSHSTEQKRAITWKSPLVNWREAQEWYAAVLHAGTDWRDRMIEGDKSSSLSKSENVIDQEFAEARAHVHQVLLRVCESLLKRPGKSLKAPEDVRGLLILLACPLLYSTDSFDVHSSPSRNTRQHVRSPSGKANPQIFGILKRALGLLSNLSDDCHRHLTSWFARYKEDAFRRLVDLIQSFVTYRLSRRHTRQTSHNHDITADLIPSFSGTGTETSARLHAALNAGSQSKTAGDGRNHAPAYSADWQVKAAARIMALLFASNKRFLGERTRAESIAHIQNPSPGSVSRHKLKNHSQLVSTSEFYNTMVDYSDLIADFDTWESAQGKFSFCQYPFFLSVHAKIRIMEYDAKRQMEIKAREAFFDSILRNRNLEQHLWLRVRRDCLVEDSLRGISGVVGTGQEEIKKGLRIEFANEEGVDAGGLRKEWFLLLIREIFDPNHGMFLFDDESGFCYFNPNSFEPSEQFFLVGAVLGLAIYNSTILDVALPPFVFKKLLLSGSSQTSSNPFNRIAFQYTLDDLAEYKPSLAKGLRQLLEYDGDVEQTFCRDFVIELERYGSKQVVPLCSNGENRPVTNSNRQEFVDLYLKFLLDVQVSRQFEPFKRGFFTVCGGNALSLFQPEEIELLVRGSDEPLDVPSLKAVAVYDNWKRDGKPVANPAEDVAILRWFWEFLEAAPPQDQRRVLSFITSSDRVPAMGTTSLVIKIAFAGNDHNRFPIARTCFNLLLLYNYRTKGELVDKLWRAVCESEGFGLK